MERSQSGRNIFAKLTCIISLGVLAALPGQATADVFTDPVGFITLTANGTNGISGNALSFWGLGMTQLVTNRGIVLAKAGTKLTVNNTLVASAFNAGSLGPLYFIEVTSGVNAGVTDDVVSNNTASVFTASDISALVASNDTYKVYPHWTIGKIFGAANDAGLQGGATAPAADQILVPNQTAQSFATYFWFTGKVGPAWRAVGGGTVDQAQAAISIDQGFLIQKLTATNLAVKLVGAVKLGQTLIPLGGTNNFPANVYASSSNTLNTCGLLPSGVLGGATAPVADNVLIHNDATGVYSTYFYFTGKGGPAWRLVGGGTVDQGSAQIPLGKSLLIQMAPGHNGFNWTVPAPY